MEHQTEPNNTIILRCDKRRYDGGSEIELIARIERQKASAETVTEPVTPSPTLEEVALEPTVTQQRKPRTKRDRLFETFIRGPLEIAVGLVGILTAGLAMLTFRQCHNQELLTQSKSVFADCSKTFWQGCSHTLTAPVRAVRLAVL